MILRVRERSPFLLILAGIALAYIAGTSLYAISHAHADPVTHTDN